MEITHDVTIDLLRPRQNVIRVVQEDSTRMIRLKLLSNNQNYNVAGDLDEGETLLKFVEFRKSDGHGGMYDTTSTGETAVELEDQSVGNVWLVALDGQCFTAPGWTQINVRFETEDGKRIHTFPIMVDVAPTASSDTESTDWGELNSIADLRNAVSELATIVEGIAGNTGLTEDMKQALLACFEHVGWEGTDGQEYYDALEIALYPPTELLSISAVFEQGEAVVYEDASLDELRSMLTVTAHYTDGTSGVVTAYTLSGTLTEGTSTVTVSYGGKTATFEVTVSAVPYITGYASVGTPSISGNEFTPSSAGYIKTTAVFSPGSSSWAIRLKVRTTSTTTKFQNLLRTVDESNTGNSAVLLQHKTTSGKYNWSLSSNGTSANISNSTEVAIADSQTKFIELAFDGTETYTVKTSDDGDSWTTVGTVTSTSKIKGGYYVAFGGPNPSGITPYNGIYYLNTMQIFIDDELWWRASA